MTRTPEQFICSIYGRQYTIMSDEDRPAIEAAAAEVESLMHQIGSTTCGGDPYRIAVLVALRLAHERNVLRQKIDESVKLGRQVSDLIDREIVLP